MRNREQGRLIGLLANIVVNAIYGACPLYKFSLFAAVLAVSANICSAQDAPPPPGDPLAKAAPEGAGVIGQPAVGPEGGGDTGGAQVEPKPSQPDSGMVFFRGRETRPTQPGAAPPTTRPPARVTCTTQPGSGPNWPRLCTQFRAPPDQLCWIVWFNGDFNGPLTHTDGVRAVGSGDKQVCLPTSWITGNK